MKEREETGEALSLRSPDCFGITRTSVLSRAIREVASKTTALLSGVKARTE